MSKLRFFFGVLGVLLLLYLADGIVLHFRSNPVGSIVVERYDAIPEKNGKTEFAFEPPTTQPCVHALFPHSGNPPCWYLSRHAVQRINY
jgi:hypothetical protein